MAWKQHKEYSALQSLLECAKEAMEVGDLQAAIRAHAEIAKRTVADCATQVQIEEIDRLMEEMRELQENHANDNQGP